MDQIYIPKQRAGMPAGSYVRINEANPIRKEVRKKRCFYNVLNLEKIKIILINEIIDFIEDITKPDNIIFTGSLLEKGFNFKDIDILIITDKVLNVNYMKSSLEKNFGIQAHILILSFKELNYGVATDPIYSSMLSHCVSQRKLIFNQKNIINFRILDLHLLKSKPLLENFDFLDGRQKYALTRNLIAILLFIEKKEVSQNLIDLSIQEYFSISAEDIKRNIINKKQFLSVYKKLYYSTFNNIMANIKNGAK